ncbi:hypothetical protein OIU74_028251 [Salix koriyanagi]|uniref:Uncharacterized protein n=1 Tax=Salix koriyanagi TaxID=2511006 RepID=A0A9Q0VBK5_9ROSI|nr:hypothetical protein OIU74_028251 [Salix koriyanagi]
MLTVITNCELIRLLCNVRATGYLAGLSHGPLEKNISDVTFEEMSSSERHRWRVDKIPHLLLVHHGARDHPPNFLPLGLGSLHPPVLGFGMPRARVSEAMGLTNCVHGPVIRYSKSSTWTCLLRSPYFGPDLYAKKNKMRSPLGFVGFRIRLSS